MNEKIDIASRELWERAKTIYLSTIRNDVEKSQVERYFTMITSVSMEDGIFKIFTSNSFAADTLRDNYSEHLKSCFDLAGADKNMAISFIYDDSVKPTIVIPNEMTRQHEEKARERPLQISTYVSTMPLSSDYTFEEFVEGPSNSWAVAAAKGVVANPGKRGYNPLFIHGGTGLGKTHIMQAIGNELRKKNPMASICYLTAEVFLNKYSEALANHKMEQFRDRYRTIDLLLVDDVQFLQRGKNCQDEFFNTFNALTSAEKQVVMTSDVAPKDLPGIEERLISRFEWGMVQEIEKPSYETRLAILKKKAEGIVQPIPENALCFIAQNISSHVRALEGALGKIMVMLDLNPNIVLTDELLSIGLKDFINKEKNLKKITIEEIQNAVCKRFQISMKQLKSNERTQSLVTPRQLAMYIAKKTTTKSQQEIADKFEKTHATIIHGVKAITKRLDVEPELKESLKALYDELGYSPDNVVD